MKSASASYTYSKKNLLATNKYKNLGETTYHKDTYKFDKKGRVKSIQSKGIKVVIFPQKQHRPPSSLL